MSSNKTPNLNLHDWSGSDRVLRTEFVENFQILDTDAATKDNKIGLLSSLTTTDKTSVVNAINEVQAMPVKSMARQAIINGNFDVWQRGMSFTNPANGAYTADRFKLNITNSGALPTITHSKQVSAADIQNSPNIYRIAPDGAGSGLGASDAYNLGQPIENGVRYLCGAGKKVTLSFWARSNIPNKKIGVRFYEVYGTGGSPSAIEVINGAKFTLGDNWAKYSVTIPMNTLVGKTLGTNNDDYLNIDFAIAWGNSVASQYGDTVAETFGGAGVIDIAQVQLCASDVALPFQPRSFAEELALCQRYYEKSYDIAVAPATSSNLGIESKVVPSNTIAVGQTYGKVSFSVKKRVAPTVVIFPFTTPSNFNRVSANSGTDLAANSGNPTNVGQSGFMLLNSSGLALTTTDSSVIFHFTSDAEI